MLFQQTLKPGQAIDLPAARILRGLPHGVILHHQKLGLRHPLGIYNTSILNVTKRMERALDSLQKAIESCKAKGRQPRYDEDLVEAYDALLDSLMEHFDDAESVLLSIIGKKKVMKTDNHVQAFRKETSDYRTHIGKLDNHIKHLQGRVRTIVMDCKEAPVLGYYAEGVDTQGVLGPSPVIHDGGDTAFSFNRDLRYHTTQMFHVSSALADAASSLCGGKIVSVALQDPGIADRLSNVIARVASLPTAVYPDELGKPWPSVVLPRPRGKHQRRLVIEYPSRHARPTRIRRLLAIWTSWEGDGASRQYRIPYTGDRWPKTPDK